MKRLSYITKFCLTIEFFYIIFSLFVTASFSQQTTEIRLASRVKQLDEFFSRFNFITDILGNKIVGKDTAIVTINGVSKTLTRRLQISALIDMMKNHKDSDAEFINDICSNGYLLNFYDKDWYAVATCNVVYKGKDVLLNLILKNEVYPDNRSKWVITGADADFLNTIPDPKDKNSIISPVSNDLNFQELSKAFSHPENLKQFFVQDFSLDPTSVFYALLQSKQLRFKGVKSIRYHFLQIKDWAFTVDFFNRSEGNSGWLLSDIISIKENEKNNYKKQVLKLKL